MAQVAAAMSGLSLAAAPRRVAGSKAQISAKFASPHRHACSRAHCKTCVFARKSIVAGGSPSSVLRPHSSAPSWSQRQRGSSAAAAPVSDNLQHVGEHCGAPATATDSPTPFPPTHPPTHCPPGSPTLLPNRARHCVAPIPWQLTCCRPSCPALPPPPPAAASVEADATEVEVGGKRITVEANGTVIISGAADAEPARESAEVEYLTGEGVGA